MENDEMMIFELLASSLIKELKEFINFNRNKQIVTEATVKRRDILSFLLKIKDKNELQKFNLDLVRIECKKILDIKQFRYLLNPRTVSRLGYYYIALPHFTKKWNKNY